MIALPAVAFELVSLLRLFYGLVTHTPFLTVGLVLLTGAVVLFVIRGLLRIAFYVALVGGVGLFGFGLVNVLF